MDSSTSGLWTGPFPVEGVYIEIHVFNAKSVDPDQMLQGLHCLLMSILWHARHKWVI